MAILFDPKFAITPRIANVLIRTILLPGCGDNHILYQVVEI